MTTALIYDPIFLEHITPENHPDKPERLQVAMNVLEALNWLERDGLVLLEPRAASEDELAAVHERFQGDPQLLRIRWRLFIHNDHVRRQLLRAPIFVRAQ